MRITLLTGVHCTPDRGSVADIDSGAFLDWLARAPSEACESEADKLAGAGFVFAQYQQGANSKALRNLRRDSCTDLLCFDVDEITLEGLRVALAAWKRVDCAVYSTWKHTADAPRLRLVVRLSRLIVNATDAEFRAVYNAAAHVLRVPFDAQAKDRARFFFGPQHKPGCEGSIEQIRFRGEPLDVDALLAINGAVHPKAQAASGEAVFAGALERPDKATVRALAKRLSGSKTESDQRVGAALSAALRGEPFAEPGSVHAAMVALGWELARAVPRLDAEWFGRDVLGASWAAMWPGESVAAAAADWLKCFETASAKLSAGRMEAQAKAARYVPEALGEMDEAALERASACAGGLVNEHRGSFYVYDPRAGVYVGPLRGTGLPAACRRCLVGVPGFSYQLFRPNSPPVLKSGPKLVEEYGCDLDSVHYWANPPSVTFESARRVIHLGAYRWNQWAPIFHPIADDLLRAMTGLQWARVELWLSKFTDLDQPLPALTMVGSRGTWKSRVAQTLSRFWGPADAPTPCDASQVLNRFSAPLLDNPVIWSDEQLARSESGKPIPEAYRRSITERVHAVERKGIDPVTLHTATRHVISVNDVDKVFGGEVDSSSVEATIERFLVVPVDGAAVAAFEARWAGRAELDRLRRGASLLEHVAWLAANVVGESAGRLYVSTDTSSEVLLAARFADDTLTVGTLIALEALLREVRTTVPGQLARLPLTCDAFGRLRLSPARVVELWPDSPIAAGSGLKKPTAQKLGRLLAKAGFKAPEGRGRSEGHDRGGWPVDHARLRDFLHVEGSHTWAEIESACARVFGVTPEFV